MAMTPYEILYGRRCRTHVCWDEVGERKLEGLVVVRETNGKVMLIRKKLRQVQDRQKKYVDVYSRILSFESSEKVFLKLSP